MQSEKKLKSREILTLIEEITLNDGEKYYEVSNMVQNGRAELAAARGYIKQVRILQLNIPRSQNVITYERYINENFFMPDENLDHFERWKRTSEMDEIVEKILCCKKVKRLYCLICWLSSDFW